MEGKEVFKSRLVGEGVIVVSITAFAYIVAYLYEYGYVSFFGVPKSFISINIVTLLIAAVSISFLVFSSAHLIGFTLPMFRTSNNVREKNVHYGLFMFLNACFLVAGIFLLQAYGISLIGFGVFIAVVIILNILIFGFKIFKPNRMTIDERFSRSNVGENDPFDIWEPIRGFFGYNIYMGFTIVIVFFGVSFVVGNSEAHRQREFLVTTIEDKPYVLVRKYDDNFILLSITKDGKYFTNTIKIKGVSSDEYISFKVSELGRLSKR